MSIANLDRVLDAAHPADVVAGKAAYATYNHITQQMAKQTGATATVAAAVFAALSPNNDYHGNLRDATKLLTMAKAGATIDSFKVSTYGNNKRKAWAIAQGTPPLDLIIANKTRNFFINVNWPNNQHAVTIDGHMTNVWRGKRERLVGLRNLTDKGYEEIAQGFRDLARERNLIPNQVQATVWLAWRRLHGILSTHQLELWNAEMLAARLGFWPTKKESTT